MGAILKNFRGGVEGGRKRGKMLDGRKREKPQKEKKEL